MNFNNINSSNKFKYLVAYLNENIVFSLLQQFVKNVSFFRLPTSPTFRASIFPNLSKKIGSSLMVLDVNDISNFITLCLEGSFLVLTISGFGLKLCFFLIII